MKQEVGNVAECLVTYQMFLFMLWKYWNPAQKTNQIETRLQQLCMWNIEFQRVKKWEMTVPISFYANMVSVESIVENGEHVEWGLNIINLGMIEKNER
jgi:hypothetical protein